MSRFELYYTLNTNLRKKDLTKKEKNSLIEGLRECNQVEHEAIFHLILEYFRETEKVDFKTQYQEDPEKASPPYSGIETDEGVEFKLTKIPIPLRHIIFKFVNILKEKRKEKI